MYDVILRNAWVDEHYLYGRKKSGRVIEDFIDQVPLSDAIF